MKAKSFIRAGVAGMILSASSAFAQSSVFVHDVVLNLKLTGETEEEVKTTTSSSKTSTTYKVKFVTGKFGVKEFLQAMVEAGEISEIKGWSLSLFAAPEGEVYGLFLTKKNFSPVNVSQYVDFDSFEVVTEFTDKDTYYNNSGLFEATQLWTERGLTEVDIEIPFFSTELRGTYTGKFDSTYAENQVSGTAPSKALPLGYYQNLKGIDLENLSGYIEGENNESDFGAPAKAVEVNPESDILVEGNVKVSDGDLTTFSSPE